MFNYLANLVHSEDKIKEIVASQKMWYHIIDGRHANEAVRYLIRNKVTCRSFIWTETIISGGHPDEKYRQLALVQYVKHLNRFHVEMTLYDDLHSHWVAYDRLRIESTTPSFKKVAQKYLGIEHVSRTMGFLASKVARLPTDVLIELWSIMNNEHPYICISPTSLYSQDA